MRLIRNVHIIVRDSPVFQDQQISIFDLTPLVLTNGLCQKGKKPYFPPGWYSSKLRSTYVYGVFTSYRIYNMRQPAVVEQTARCDTN